MYACGQERVALTIFLGVEGDEPSHDDVILDLSDEETVRQEIDLCWRQREQADVLIKDFQCELMRIGANR